MVKPLIVAVLAAGAWCLPHLGSLVRAQGPAGAPAVEAGLPGEWIYPRASREVLAAVRATLREAGLRLEHDEGASGALVTRFERYDPARWPDAAALDLPSGHTPATVQFHLHVSPGLEPARVAVGAVLDTAVVQAPMAGARARGGARFYSHRRLAAGFLERLSARLGVQPEPLASTTAARTAQARRLLPAGLAGGCGVKDVPPLGGPGGRTPERLPRRTRYEVLPLYPQEQQGAWVGGEIQIGAEITEHGTVVNLTTEVDALGDGNLKATAFGAAGLWRYQPAVLDGCPVPIGVTLGIQFAVERR